MNPRDAVVIGARFDTADLTEIRWERSTLTGYELHNTDLRGAEPRGTDLSHIRGATIEHAQLPGLTDALAHDLELTIR